MAHIPSSLSDLTSFLDQLEQEGTAWHKNWSQNWDKYADTMRGRRKMNSDPTPIFRAPLTIPAVLRKAALLVENKPSFDIKVRKSGFQKTSEILKHVILAQWDEQYVQMQLEMLALYVEVFGCGLMAIEYDNDADYGAGGIRIRAVDPRLVKIDPAIVMAADLCKAQYIIEKQIVPLSFIHTRWPATGKEVEPDNSLNMTGAAEELSHKWSWYQTIMGRLTKYSVDYSAIPRCILNRFWIADEDSEAGYALLYRTGDGVVLNPKEKDQENPYFDGNHPYEMLDSEADLDAPFGHSEVERLGKIDEPFNRIGNLFAKNMLRNVPWVVADMNSLDQETKQELLEREEIVIEKAAGRNVVRTPAPAPTGDELNFLMLLQGLVNDFTGTKESGLPGGGKGRVELRSQPQLEGLQTAGMTLVRSQARRLEAFLERLGQKWISRIFQFLPDDQIISYVDQGEIKTFDLQKQQLIQEIIQDAHSAALARQTDWINEQLAAGRKFSERLIKQAPPDYANADDLQRHMRQAWRKFRFKIVPLSTLAQVRVQRAMMLEQLAQQGMIPSSMVVKEAGFDNPEELMLEAAREMQLRQQLGFPPPAPPSKNRGKK